MKVIHPIALFRLSVLGPLASRDRFEQGELKKIIRELASKTYDIPHSNRVRLSEATVERWYYAWKKGGIDALMPTSRKDRGCSQLPADIQQAILSAKKENPSRSINAIVRLLEQRGEVSRGQLSRSSVHRFLQSHQLSSRTLCSVEKIERRAFVAEHVNDIWQGDVLHGPRLFIQGRHRKTYLVSLMDDASRLITHSEFRLGETALDIQAVLKQALLKRGLPNRIILDNGAAYRSGELQAICARLKIRLVYCPPYEPQGKGKLERWHARFRNEFLSECDFSKLQNVEDLNARLWAYLDHLYHVSTHGGLDKGMSPLKRWRQDISHIRSLGVYATQIDEIFYYREQRRVRKDGCIVFKGQYFEVPYELSGQNVMIVFDPEKNEVKWVESKEGKKLGDAALLDAVHNTRRKRQRPIQHDPSPSQKKPIGNAIELAYQDYQRSLLIKPNEET